jgi:hypothetical protein
MDLLCTAVVDITTLTATCRALARGPITGKLRVRHKLRKKLCKELRRGVEAYIDTLGRSKRAVLNGAHLASCRAAAEAQMPRSLRHERELSRLMSTAPGSMLGVAAARQDLWRLAHLAIHLRQGVAALRASVGNVVEQATKKSGWRLRRRLTRALTDYARACQRDSANEDHMIATARKAALRTIGTRGRSEADGLGRIEATVGATHTVIRLGVVKPLADLVLDWRPLANAAGHQLLPAERAPFAT